ncbi:unnamed protein product [Brassica oleracea]
MKLNISEENNIRFDSQPLKRISKPDHDEDDEETQSPSGTEEVIPLSCAFTRQEHCLSESREREESIRRLRSLIFLYLTIMSLEHH